MIAPSAPVTPSDPAEFFSKFDAVVMLTWSNWRSEMRGNRYHYATRFARHLPVFFVQPDLEPEEYRLEDSNHPGITLVHVHGGDEAVRDRLLSGALNEAGCRKPLIWVYNPTFAGFISRVKADLKIYHATENYFDPHFFPEGASEQEQARISRAVKSAICECDGVICVSAAVARSYAANLPQGSELITVENGCDFEFFDMAPNPSQSSTEPVALYQGNISWKLDFALLSATAAALPDWQFHFAGPVIEESAAAFARLCEQSNVRHLGLLSPGQLAAEMKKATVGLIPFENKGIWSGSYPLKALEYVACGLPVVSTPIEALEQHRGVIEFATTAAEFADCIEQARERRHNVVALALRRSVASRHSYDARFDQAVRWMAALHDKRRLAPGPREGTANVLMLYDHGSMHVGTISEHLEAFATHSSRVNYVFCPATFQHNELRNDIVHAFDAVIVHYCVRVCVPGHMTREWEEELAIYRGLKILFIQDEYDNIEITRCFIERAGINVVYTVVPDAERHKVYPPERFPGVRFIGCLTGYVGADFKNKFRDLGLAPPSMRSTVFAYRGRRLPYFYGSLGQEKREIGDRMKRYCQEHGIPADIETDDARRIYGDDWWRFLGGSRATLGSESGSNLFDQGGELRSMLAAHLAAHPDATYEETRRALHPHFEEHVRMNQVSPKVFEAIATRTALVLFEGEYSGVAQPDRHFIPLKKDFSNVDEVVAKVLDDEFIDAITQLAYDEIILPETWSAARFFQQVEATLLNIIRPRTRRVLALGDDRLTRSLASFRPLTAEMANALALKIESSEIRGLRETNAFYLREITKLNDYYPAEISRLKASYLKTINDVKAALADARERGDRYRDKWKEASSGAKLKQKKSGDKGGRGLLAMLKFWR